MKTALKPEGYTTVSPYLICPRAADVITFAREALGAELIRSFDHPDGGVMHAELRIDDTVVMIGDAGEAWPAAPAHLHVYVREVDAVYAKALASGASSVQPPESKDDGDRRGGVKDAGGNTWWLAQQL